MSMGSMWIGNSHYSYVFSFRGGLWDGLEAPNLVTTHSLAGKAGTAPIKTGWEMRKTRVNTGFHEHAESVGRLRRLRKSRYSLNNPETWASACRYSAAFGHCPAKDCSVATPASVGSLSGFCDVTFPNRRSHCAAAKKNVLSCPLYKCGKATGPPIVKSGMFSTCRGGEVRLLIFCRCVSEANALPVYTYVAVPCT